MGGLEKEKVRNLARAYDLKVAHKPDSQDICFVGKGGVKAVLESGGQKLTPGNFIDKTGKILGKHNGYQSFTIGQRKGLGIALGEPAYVTKIIAKTGEVMLGTVDDLMGEKLIADQANWLVNDLPKVGDMVEAKIRYASPSVQALIEKISDETFSLKFLKPVKAITPGQSCVLYDGDKTLGGGKILR
jgi:tRNA-specific 2-thiouridylase